MYHTVLLGSDGATLRTPGVSRILNMMEQSTSRLILIRDIYRAMEQIRVVASCSPQSLPIATADPDQQLIHQAQAGCEKHGSGVPFLLVFRHGLAYLWFQDDGDDFQAVCWIFFGRVHFRDRKVVERDVCDTDA
jgi:hypothetical protein